MIMTEPPPEIARILSAASAARQRGQVDEEERLLESARNLAPELPQTLNALGMHALAKGDNAGAVQWFSKAVAADPKAPELWMNLAKAQRLLGDDAGERGSLEAAIALNQLNFMAWLRKAELHERLGETAQAAKAWTAVLEMAKGMNPVPPTLTEAVAHARRYVDAHTQSLGEALDEGLAAERLAVSARERRRFEAALDFALGRRSIFVNSCAGLHFPFLPADEFFDREHFPWLAGIEEKTEVIRAELEALVAARYGGFRPYVQQEAGTPKNLWSDLDQSFDWSALFLWEYGVRNDAVCDLCPETAAALDALPRAELPARAPSAFFSLLKPRSHIPPHTGVSNTRAIIHLPLIVPDGCRFRVGGETRAWKLGEAFAFDDTIEHEAWNDSDELRAVLIFDVWNPHLTETERRLLQRFYAVADASGHNPEPVRTA